jgi:hypothetical protein
VTLPQGATVEDRWRVVQTGVGHWVDLACTVATEHYLCAWGYACLIAPQRAAVTLCLTTCTPAEVWINGVAVVQHAAFAAAPVQVSFSAQLTQGVNELLVRVATVGVGDVPLAIGLHGVDLPGVGLQLPTTLEPVARRQKLAAIMAAAQLAQPVYGREQKIVVRWPKTMDRIDALTVRLQTPSARIYAEAHPIVQRGSKVDFGEARQFPDGEYEVVLQPQFEEFYVQDLRVQQRLPLRIATAKWSALYYGTPEERRQEALHAAAKRKDSLAAEVANVALGQWTDLRREVVDAALARIAQHAVGSARDLMLLLGLAARFRDLPDFPDDLGWALEECVTQMAFAQTPLPGLLSAGCRLLAGQLYADRTFADHHAGEWQRMQGEQAVRAMLLQLTQLGLPQGESSGGLADTLVALSHLTDLAVSDEIAELAAVAIDKLGYLIALATFQGMWGGSQEGATTHTLFAGGLSPLSGVTRLWWGQGAFTADDAATVALACAESYQLPEIIAAVAVDRREVWSRRHDWVYEDQVQEEWGQTADGAQSLYRAALRSADYLLASAQGPRAWAGRTLAWQVTLGSDAVIFGNHPTTPSEQDAWAANYWRGNRQAPSVAQWHDWLAIAYAPDGEALPFTHAYFPVARFDEVDLRDGWAFARKGEGYVAITATGGVALTSVGLHAQRELTAAAPSVWLVQMGRGQTDGTWQEFMARILARELVLTTTDVRFAGLRGASLALTADGALVVDGQVQPVEGAGHILSPFGSAQTLPADLLDITYDDHVMRLDFGSS